MIKCKNCGSILSCGCKKRKAQDGKEVCTKCKGAYNAKLRAKKK